MAFHDDYLSWRKKRAENSFTDRFVQWQIRTGRINDAISKLNADVQSWYKKYNDYYGGGNSAYRSADSVKSTNDAFAAQAKSISDRLILYRKCIDADWARDVKRSLNIAANSYDRMYDYWSQWDNELDYNIYSAISSGQYDEADRLIKSEQGKLISSSPKETFANIEQMKKLSEYSKTIDAYRYMKENNLSLEQYNAMVEEAERAKEEEKRKKEEIKNAPGWQRTLATVGDFINRGGYAVAQGLETVNDGIGRALVGAGDFFNDALDDIGKPLGRRNYNFRWENWKEGYLKGLDYEWAKDTFNIDEDFNTVEDFSYLSEVPELQKTIHGVIDGVGQMAPAVALGLATGGAGAGAAYMSTLAGGSAIDEALKEGADLDQAIVYGQAMAALEGGSELMGGSIFGAATDLMGTALGRWIVKSGGDKFFGKGIGKVAYTFASEGFEEIIMDIATPLAQSAFDIGDAQDTYFGEDWKKGWGEVISGIPETFVVGGAVGSLIEGFHSSVSALSNKDKGGFKYNKIADEMTIIENALKAQEAVKQSKKATPEIIDAFSTKTSEKVSASVQSMSETMQKLTPAQRAEVFADAPMLEMFLNEEGGVSEGFKYFSAKGNTEIISLIDKISKGEFKDNEKVYLNNVSDDIAGRIQELTGVDVRGFKVAIEARQLRHILNDHGKSGKTDQSMIHSEDISKLDYVLSNPDNITKSGKTQAYSYMKNGYNRTADTVLYEKNIGEQSYYAVQAIPDTKAKTLYIVTAFIGKSGYQKGASQLINANSPNATSKSGSANTPISSISQDGTNVNSKISTELMQYAELAGMGENGVQLMREVYDGKMMSPEKFFEAYNAIYAAGKKGGDVRNRYVSLLGENVAAMARNAGQMDALKVGKPATAYKAGERAAKAQSTEYSPEVLPNGAESGTINTNGKEAQNEQGLHLRQGGEWYDGQNTQGQIPGMEGGARPYQSRTTFRRSKDIGAAALSYDREVSAKSLGIEGGVNSKKVKLVAEGRETAAMKSARTLAESRGLKVTFFAGDNLYIAKDSKIASVRGYVKGNEVFVRADHADYTSDQIMRHEVGHDMIAKGEVDVAEVKGRITKQYGQENVQFISDRYSDAYEGSGLSAEEIWEEIVCDSLGDMNVFASVDVLGNINGEFLQILKSEVKDSAKDARGPPTQKNTADSGVGKFSVETEPVSGEKFVAIEKESIMNLMQFPGDSVSAKVRNFLKQYRGTVLQLGSTDKAYMRREAEGEYTNPAKAVSEADYVGKLNASSEITNMLATGRFVRHENDNGRHPDAVRGWNYYQLNYVVPITDMDIRAYSAEIQIKLIDRGDCFYDITKIRDITHGTAGQALIKAAGSVYNTSTNSISQKPDLSTDSAEKNSGKEGKASQDLEFVDFLNENAEKSEQSDRELLAQALESDALSPSEKGFLTRYKNSLSKIEANEAEIEALTAELEELRKNGNGDGAKAVTLENKIRTLEKQNAVSEGVILNLEATKPLKRLLQREREAAYAEGMLAGQMAQGKDDAPKLRRAEEKLDAVKRRSGETMAEYKKRVAEREKQLKLEARERMDAQREKAREAIDKQAKRYQESRKKSAEGRHKTEMRHKIQRVVAELDKLLRHGNKKSNVKIGLQDAVAAALEAFDINAEKVERYNKDMSRLDVKIAAATDPMEIEALTALREKKQRNSERLADKLQAMKKAYEDIHNGRDGENYPGYYKAEAEVIENRIAEVIEKVGNTPIGEMSLDQLDAVYDMYRMVLTTVQNANKVFRDGKLADLTSDATDMTSELQKIKKLPEERLKAGENVRGFVWNELTPYYAFKRVGSGTLMSYYDELVRGQDVYARDVDEAKQFALDTRKKHGYGKWKLDEVHSFRDKDGRKFDLTLKHMMSIYAYSKREQALDHMENGGFFFNNKETFRKKAGVLEFIASNESGYKVDASVFAKIKSSLTAEQIAYVDEMQSYLTKMGEKGNEVTRVMWGIDIFKEKVYFPLKSKEDFIYQANTPAETSSLKNDGMTKETKPHASNPIVLEAFDEVWANHVEKMSKYHGFVIPIDNLNKLINYGTWMEGDAQANTVDLSADTELSALVEGVYGSAKYKKIAQYILDVLGKKEISLSDGRLAIVDNSDALHIANRAAPRKTAKIAKINEIIQKAQIYAQDLNVSHNKFDSFYYYETTVKFGEEIFPVYLNVGKAKNDGKYHIYDITNKIRDTADRINGLERPKPNEGYALKNGISTKSIPQNSENVNSKFSTNAEMGSHSISTMLEARFGSGANDYLTTFIKDLNGAKAQSGGFIGGISNLFTKFKKTAVGASFSVVVQQPTAIIRATSEIDAKYFAHLPKVESLNKKWEQIQKYAPIAIIKDIGGFDAGSGRTIAEWINADTRRGVKRALNKIDDVTMYGAALGDRVGWGAIWTAVGREVQAKQHLKYGTEEFSQACGKRFTEVIVKTQVYDSTLSRSGFMRSKDSLMKMATAFMGEPTLSINMLADTVLQAKRGRIKKGKVVRTVAAVFTSTVAASIIKSFIYALRDEDEDEAYMEKYLQALGGSILSDANPLNMLPVLRDVMSILDGWDIERTDMAILKDIYNAATALSSENKTTYRKIEDFAGAIAALAGVPLKNLMRTGREIYNAFNDAFDGIEGGDLGGAFLEGVSGKEKSKSQTLYEALIDGDPERIYAIKNDYKTADAYAAAVRKALRDYDPRIKKAGKALYDGDLVTRNDLLYEIVDEGVFDEETVLKAIDAEADKIAAEVKAAEKAESDVPWYDRENDEETPVEGSIYSASDIGTAFDYCSDELALEIIAELTELKVGEIRTEAEKQGREFDEASARDSVRSTLRSSMTKHYKPLYRKAYASGDSAEMHRIEEILISSGLYVYKTKKDVDDVLDEWIEEE